MRQNVALCLAAAAAVSLVVCMLPTSDRTPTPAPPPVEDLWLRGKFVGPTAGEDAAMVAGLTAELALILEYDSTLPRPRITTGIQADELRRSAREMRLRGDSLAARQPKAVMAIAEHMQRSLGDEGGPLTPDTKTSWIIEYRAISRAAEVASK